jgi:hypothetical protein
MDTFLYWFTVADIWIHGFMTPLRILHMNSLSDEQVESLLLSVEWLSRSYIYIYTRVYIYIYSALQQQKVLFKLTVPWGFSPPIFSRNKLILVPQARCDFKVLWIFAEIFDFFYALPVSLTRNLFYTELLIRSLFDTELFDTELIRSRNLFNMQLFYTEPIKYSAH